MYSISFGFEDNVRYGYIELPIENRSPDSPAASFITKQLLKLNCQVVKHVSYWGYRKTPNRFRCCWTPAIKFIGSTEAMQQLVKLYGTLFQQVPDRPTRVFQDKFLWRCVVRPLFPDGTGTPVTVDTAHLPALKSALACIDDFTTSPYSDGRIHHGSISKQDLAGLPSLIDAIEKDGYALVID